MEYSSNTLARHNFTNKNNNKKSIQEKEKEKLKNKKRKREKNQLGNNSQNIRGKSNKDNNIGKHNCSSKDNITIKIRTIIKKNSINKEIKFIKFRTKFVANLKKDKNVNLLETKLIDILKNQPISTKK